MSETEKAFRQAYLQALPPNPTLEALAAESRSLEAVIAALEVRATQFANSVTGHPDHQMGDLVSSDKATECKAAAAWLRSSGSSFDQLSERERRVLVNTLRELQSAIGYRQIDESFNRGRGNAFVAELITLLG